MGNTVIRLYDDFDVAENARNALITSGIPADKVHLVANEDEAGGVQGNFYIGNGNHDDESYKSNYADVKYRSAYMLTVDTADEQQSIFATGVLNKSARPAAR